MKRSRVGVLMGLSLAAAALASRPARAQEFPDLPRLRGSAEPLGGPWSHLRPLPWEPGDPVPAGYHVESKIRAGLVAGGVATFTGPYVLTVALTAQDHDTHSSAVYVPVVGPFILIGQMGTPRDAFPGITTAVKGLLALDGLVQAGGVAMIACGIAIPKKVLVRNGVAALEVRPTPLVLGHGGSGLGLAGTF